MIDLFEPGFIYGWRRSLARRPRQRKNLRGRTCRSVRKVRYMRRRSPRG